MKISTHGQSRFLTHDEVRTPLVVTMERVSEDRSLRNPYVLHFAPAHQLKPLPLNVTNRRILVATYGDDDAAWRGQLVELYFNPSIPNPRNPQLPGGICVRIPAGPGNADDGHRTAAPPHPKPTPPPTSPAPRRATVGRGSRRAVPRLRRRARTDRRPSGRRRCRCAWPWSDCLEGRGRWKCTYRFESNTTTDMKATDA